MKKFAQILNRKAHWIFEREEKPNFAPNIEIVEITNLDPQPKEGWIYENGEFREPTEGDLKESRETEKTLEERVEDLRSDNTVVLMALADLYSEVLSLKGDGN